MDWWLPLAIIGGAVIAGAVAFFLPAREPRDAATEGPGYERAETRTGQGWNPWAFVAIGAVIAAITGLAVGLWLG